MSVFGHIELAPADPILSTAIAFKNDTHPKKVNLGIGAYRDNDGKPVVLDSVRDAELAIANDKNEVKEYAPIDGQAPNKELTQTLLFGAGSSIVSSGRIASCQALSGTGSLRVSGEFIKTYMPNSKTVYLPDPSWGNHKAIFQKSGLEVKTYPYWDAAKKNLNFEGMLNGIKAAPSGSIILLHSVAHNPTGIDPTPDQWKQVVEACQSGGLVPMIDNAYQGFASGCLEKDAMATRMFGDSGMEFFICQSFAKNMGLYGERIGMLHVVCKDKDIAAKVLSQVKLVVRAMYSSPPIHGAQLINRILSDNALRTKWAGEVKFMADRINDMRGQLRSSIEKLGTPGEWNHITDQIGMFSYTGLTKNQCELLIDKWHIYLLKNGRISMAGVNTNNVQYIAEAINDAVVNVKNEDGYAKTGSPTRG